jgi:hypothetical protein
MRRLNLNSSRAHKTRNVRTASTLVHMTDSRRTSLRVRKVPEAVCCTSVARLLIQLEYV